MLKRFPSTRLVLLSNEGESVRRRQRCGEIAGEGENKRKEQHREGEREGERTSVEISLLSAVAFEVVR